MSWMNGGRQPPQHASGGGGQSLPLPPAVTAIGPQSGSVGFIGSGGAAQQPQQQQGWQTQPLHAYPQQPPQYPSQQQVYAQTVQSNIYTSSPGSQPLSPNNNQVPWQQQQQQPQPQKLQQFQMSSSQYFNKPPPPLQSAVNNYTQQNLIVPPTPPQSTPQHYQQDPQFFHQSQSPNLPNANNQQTAFIKPDQQQPQQQQQFAGMNSVQQHNDNQSPPQQQPAEGWDDWEWNDNNQSLTTTTDQVSQQQNMQNLTQHHNVIADSFAATNQTDNWKWQNEDNNNSNLLQTGANVVHDNEMFGPTSLGNVSMPSLEDQAVKQVRSPSVGSIGAPPSIVQPTLSCVQQIPAPIQQSVASVQQTQSPVHQSIGSVQQFQAQSQPTIQTVSSVPQSNVVTTENPGNTVSNNVYVSQAKPVSQPARQYAMTPSLVGAATPDLHPPPSQTPPAISLPPPPPLNPTPPPPSSASLAGSNPYKRAGVAQHHHMTMAPAKSHQPPAVMQNQFFGSTSGDFQQHNTSGNQECLAPDNSEVIDSKNFEVENLEVAPSNDRNQYLQTDHLSEERFNNVGLSQEQNDQDNILPPPGLSRFVLGEPEADNSQSNGIDQSDIPPGLDRMIPGTELVTAGINMERQADGQDTMPAPRSAFSNVPTILANESPSQIDITDRNLYLVPGESDAHEQRIVTGLENDASSQAVEQREVEMDGENLEDQQQQQLLLQHQNYQADIEITREEPIEGANTQDSLPSPTTNHETESSVTIETNQKDASNPSTANDDSDHNGRHQSYHGRNARKQEEAKKRNRVDTKDRKDRKDRYGTEESDDYYSSDRDRKFREGSVRSDRGGKDRDSKERDRRDRREGSVRDRDRYRDEKDGSRDNRRYERDRHRDKYDRVRDRDGRQNSSRYETDSKYETETSTRYEHGSERRRGDRSDRGDRDRHGDYRRGDDKEKRHRRGDERNDRDDRDRRRDNDRDYRDRRRGDRSTRGGGGGSSNEFDDDAYSRRTVSSRNDRDRDYKDRSARDVKDPRYPANMYGYPAGYGYDAYSYYQQHQQYYEQLRRTNPQAYAEWYRKYYGQLQGDLLTNDGRESVHSGRSSANNDKDRYNYHQQYFQHSNDYQQQQQRHFMHPPSIGSSLNSTAIVEQSYNLSRGPSTGNLSQCHLETQQQPHQAIAGSYHMTAASARSYYSQNDYLDLRSDQFNISSNVIDSASTAQEPQRLTPLKFTIDHSITTLANGLMVCVKPKYSQNGVTNIVKIWKFASNDATKRLFNSFPGPLVRGITHKKTIIEFCEDQIRLGPASVVLRSRNNSMSSVCSNGTANRGSFTLMWTLLILLLRQNGMVVGTDIAELLMKNRNQYPYETITMAAGNAQKSSSRNNSIQSDQRKSKSPSDPDERDSTDEKAGDSDVESDSKKSLSEVEITEKFRNYLLYGNVNEALEWATDNNLWGHALFLASKVDRRLHANVMMKFANKLALNDPLQTLYQLMSGRTPSSVTSVQDEKWGDWRPHLAMILSNTSQRPDLDRKAITTLGDSLYNRGDLFGAQFCYLMAQVGFGRYSSVNQDSNLMSNSANTIRLVLLGSSHHKSFKDFASNEAIMMTEIYEYACALNDEKFSLVEFQPYKYLLALRMLDYGMQLKALTYMEQIARHIQLDPSKYETSFIEKVFILSDRLKFVDPMLEKSMDDQENVEVHQVEDQQWLQSLRAILTDSNAYVAQALNELPTRSQIDQQFTEINQQFSALSLQYNNFETPVVDQQQQPIYAGTVQSASLNDGQYQQNSMQYQPTTGSGMESGAQSTEQYGQYYGQQQMNSLPPQNSVTSDYGSYGPQSYDQPQSYEQEQTPSLQPDQSQGYGSGYWDQQQQQLQNDTSRPQISMPNSLSNKSGFYDDSNENSASASTAANQPNQNSTMAGDKKSGAKVDSKKSSGGSNANSGWFGGIWNKLSLKPKNQMILPDDKNPAIVWDPDKKRWTNTDGVEDEQSEFKPPPKMADIVQTAYNSNRKPSVGNGMPPQQQQHQQVPMQQQQQQAPMQQQQQQMSYGPSDVPMMSTNYSPQQQQQQQETSNSPGLVTSATTNSMSAAAANAAAGPVGSVAGGEKVPNLQSNMFKMQRNRTLKKSYVDVFNPSGAVPSKPVEPILAPTLPAATVPQGGIFVPAPVPGDDGSQYQQQQQQQQQMGMPQFYNPNQFSAGNQ